MKKAYLLLLSFLVLIQYSCSKQQLDKINTDPTKSTEEDYNPDFLLSTAQFRFSNKGYYQLLYQSTMMQLLSSTYFYYNNGDKYVNAGNFTDYQGRIFDEGYVEAARIREMQRLAKEKDSAAYANLIHIGDMMFVLILQRITDTYGDVPYAQAARAREGIKYPVYDKQEDIYTAMLTDLDQAIKGLDLAKPKPTADLFYHGDIVKWKKFGYSLMLRVAMRLTKADPDKARLWAEKAAAGTFSTIDDNAIVITDETNLNTQNGTSLALRTQSDYREVRWSKMLIDYLKANSDPRLTAIAEVPPDGLANNTNEDIAGNTDPAIQIGLPNGYDLAGGTSDIRNYPGYPGSTGKDADLAPLGKYSRPRTAVYLKLGGPNIILTYAETELLLAEAKLRGWNIPGTAAAHYANGLTGALKGMAQIDPLATIAPAVISDYVAKHPLDQSTQDRALEMINLQYWVTTGTNFNFIESWLNWKRSDYPKLVPVNYAGNVTNGTIPRRMIYLSTEILNNTDNYKAAVARLAGGDVLTSRVWWDK